MPLSNMARRVLDHVETAQPSTIVAGTRWYPEVWEWCQEVAALAGLSPEAVAGAVAALSPRCGWAVNKRWAATMVAAWRAGDDQPPALGIYSNRRKAWDILNGREPLHVLGGNKVRAFYRNIIGDPEPVTVDRWVYYGATGTKGQPTGAGTYNAVAQAVADAARYLQLTPRDCQAVLWVVVRGGAE